MLDTWLRKQGVHPQVSITYTTYEQSYIQAFGPKLHTVAAEEFSRRGIAAHTQYVVDRVEPGRVFYKNGEALPMNR